MSHQVRIAAVSLSHGEPILMLAGYVNGQIHVIKSERLPKRIKALQAILPDKLDKLRTSGFLVVVDETLPAFAKYGRPLRLSDIGSDERPVIVSAMEAYNSLTSLEAISLPKGSAGSYDISPSVVEEVRGARSEIGYRINWEELLPENAVLLIAIHAAISANVYDSTSIDALFEALGAKRTKPQMAHRFTKITNAIDERINPIRHGREQDGDLNIRRGIGK